MTSDVLVPPEATEVVFSPCVHMDPGDPAAMFSGYEGYEQRLRQWLAAIEFGPGFRFIVDPFRNEQDMSYDTLPDHPEFIGGLSARLSELYPSVEGLTRSWATSPALPDFATAAAAIPVTSGCLVDAAGHMYRLGKGTRYFGDVGAYRDDRAEELNCRIADAFKSVHDVPVIFKHNVAFKGMFTNSRDKGGFDGLGWESYGDAASLVVHNAGVCFAEAEQSAHTMWSVVTETSPAAFETQKEEIGYVTPQRMFDAFDTFLRAGAKGLFVFGFTFDPPGGFMTTEVIRDPRNLQWMAAYKRGLEASAERVAAYKPNYAYCYPARQGFAAVVGDEDFAIDGHTGGGKVFPLPGGSWVLPAESRDVETPLLIGTRTGRRWCGRHWGASGGAQVADASGVRQQVLGCRFLPKEHGRIRLYSEDLKLMLLARHAAAGAQHRGNAGSSSTVTTRHLRYETAWRGGSVAELSVARPEGDRGRGRRPQHLNSPAKTAMRPSPAGWRCRCTAPIRRPDRSRRATASASRSPGRTSFGSGSGRWRR